MNESQQQLSPVTGYPQWETIERGEQQQQQHQIESPLDTSMDSTTPTGPTPIAFRTINLEMDEMSRNLISHQASTSQMDNTPIILQHPHALHQQLHLQHQHHQQQQQFHQRQQYHGQQSRQPSVEPFSTQISRPGSSSQHHIATSPTDAFSSQSTTPNPATESGPSTSNTAGGRNTSRKTSGPIRSSGRVTRAQQQAPYFRPSPASTTASYLGLEVPRAGSSGSSTPRLPQQAEPQPRKQTVRFTAAATGPGPIQTRAASRAAASSMGSPAPQLPEFAGSAATPRQTEIGFSPMTRRASRQATSQTQAPSQQPPSAHSHSPPQAPPSSNPQTQPQTQPPQASSAAIRSYLHARRRYPLNITSDMHYSQSSNILHASLELPGVKKQDVHIKLATCYFNHVKFISVHAESNPVFDLPGAVESGTGTGSGAQDTSSETKQKRTSINPDLRERRFGSLKRVIQVPSTTKVRNSHFSNPLHPLVTLFLPENYHYSFRLPFSLFLSLCET
ncbi:hypothetical protein BYT27DRAFT_7143328 [Phlegmacium glaucopus]|nr:hypothetical protein BYT27DRAFT_7143328 [Phlegmacium glaucopus]